MKRLSRVSAGIVVVLLCSMWIAQCTQAAKEIPITTSSEEALSLYLEGKALAEKSRFNEAREKYNLALEKDPDMAIAYLYRGYASETGDEYIRHIDKAASLADKVSEGEKLLILAIQARHNGDDTKANDMFERLAALYPSDKTVFNEMGLNYWSQNDFEKSVEAYKTAIDIDPEYPDPYNMLGYAYSRLGKYDEAESALKTYAELIPDESNPWDSYGEILMKQGKFDESIAAYQKAIDLDPQFAIAYRGVCMNKVFKGQADEGRKELVKLNEAAQTDGDRYTALHVEALSYLCEGDYKNALRAKQKCLQMAEKQNDVLGKANDLFNMADIYLLMDKPDQAQKSLDGVAMVMKNSDHSEKFKKEWLQWVHYTQTEIALKKQDLEQAKAAADLFRQAAEQDEDANEIKAAFELDGMIALHENRYDDAIAAFEQTNQQNPRNFCGLAQAYMKKGDKAKAQEYWEKAAHFNDMSWNYARIRAKAMKMVQG